MSNIDANDENMLTQEVFNEAINNLAKALGGVQVDVDNDGQIVIYTGLKKEDGIFIPIE